VPPEKNEIGSTSRGGLNEWIVFEKPDGGGRVAMWPSAIVGVEEFKPPLGKPPVGRANTKEQRLDVFIHSNDFCDPIPVKESFEEVVERTRKAWAQENEGGVNSDE
jgi:hypothetical protein